MLKPILQLQSFDMALN